MEDKIHLLLSMQEHPEKYKEEQITNMLADDPELAELMEQLAITKRAFAQKEADQEQIPMDNLWEQFAREHADEIDALDTVQEQQATGGWSFGRLGGWSFGHLGGWSFMGKALGRVAAVLIGIILTVGVAFAAIHILRTHPNAPKEREATREAIIETHSQTPPKGTEESVQEAVPVTFDNVTLDSIAKDIAAYHHIEMDLQNEQARQLRFYFVWKQDDSLQEVIEKLNMFEQVNMAVENGKLIVR